MSATPEMLMRLTKRDIDPYDGVCDHLLVIDHSLKRGSQVVGTYRLLREEIATANGGFYSQNEFDVSPLLKGTYRKNMKPGQQLLELGRSCVHKNYRSSSVINLLWQGIASYIKEYDIAYLFGCASFEGTDPKNHKEALSYLYHHHVKDGNADRDSLVYAQRDQYVHMNMMKKDDIDVRRARRHLPPLIKGYLRVGCSIGSGAVVDQQFGTVDVFILMPVDAISRRYSKRFDVKKPEDQPESRP